MGGSPSDLKHLSKITCFLRMLSPMRSLRVELEQKVEILQVESLGRLVSYCVLIGYNDDGSSMDLTL